MLLPGLSHRENDFTEFQNIIKNNFDMNILNLMFKMVNKG